MTNTLVEIQYSIGFIFGSRLKLMENLMKPTRLNLKDLTIICEFPYENVIYFPQIQMSKKISG